MSRYRRTDFDQDELCLKSEFDKMDVMGFTNPNSSDAQLFTSENTLTGPDNNRALTITSYKEDESPLPTASSETSEHILSKPIGLTNTSVIINKGRLRKRNFWNRSSPLEKLLLISIIILIIFSFVLLLIIFNSQASNVSKGI